MEEQKQSGMPVLKRPDNKTGLYTAVVITALIIIAGAYFFTRDGGPSVPIAPAPADSGRVEDGVKVFEIRSRPFEFEAKEIKVDMGDRVRINLINEEGFHDWVLDEFNVRTTQINGGQTATVEFTADRAGSFEFYCSVGNHRQMGMVGTLIVE